MKLFTLSYRFFTYIKPSQLWIIILALLNKTEFKKLISIPSMFLLFNTLFTDPNGPNLNSKALLEKLEINKFTNSENK
jgi:hypothetical protein